MPEMVNAATAAELLGVDRRTVVRLARSGKIRSFRTPGGQHRFRREDLESLASGNGHTAEMRAVAPSVQSKRQEVEELGLELQSRRVRRDLAKIEAEDAEVERQRAEAQRVEGLANKRALAEIRLTRSQAREERQREAQQEAAERERAAWLTGILDAALSSLPRDVPAETRKSVGEAVRESLAQMGPGESLQLVEAAAGDAVTHALAPWRRACEIERAIAHSEKLLPFQARGFFGDASEWQLRVRAAASAAIRALPDDAPLLEIRAAADQAAQKIASEFERIEAENQHSRDCQHVVNCVSLRVLPGDLELAKQAVRESLARLPVGCGYQAISESTDRALAPFERRKEAEPKARLFYLPHIGAYVEELGAPDGDWDLGDYSERCKFTAQLERKILPKLIGKMVAGEIEDEEDAEEFIEDFVDRELAREA